MTKQDISLDPSKLEEASSWYARVNRDDATVEDSRALTQWLEDDEKNVAAFHYIEDLMADIEDFSPDLNTLLEADTQSTADNTNILRPPTSFWQKNRTITRWASGAAAACLAFLFMVPNALDIFSPNPQAQVYSASVHAIQQIDLADGTRIDLNKNTRLEVTMKTDSRHASLIEGEALFTVSKDSRRPFFITVGDTQVEVVGTVFNILRHAGEVTVTVSEGIVDVSPLPKALSVKKAPTFQKERLTAGKQLRHIEGTETTAIRTVQANNIVAWRDGQLIYNNAPLTEVAKDLKRYFNIDIQVHDDAADFMFSGVLNTNDRASVFALLEFSMPIKISRLNHLLVIRAQQK